MTVTNKIEGILRLTSPLHCASTPGDGDYSGNNNITMTQKRKLLTNSGARYVPMFPGNDLRGRLRRVAAGIVLDHITASSKVSVTLYQGLMGGAVTTKLESDLTIEEAVRARDNVYMGLFGGATRVLPSRYTANDLIPVLQDTVDLKIVPLEFVGDEGVPKGPIAKDTVGPLTGFHLVDTRTSFKLDDVADATRPDELEKYVEDAINKVAQLQGQSLAQAATRKADKAAAKTGDIRSDQISKKQTLSNMFTVESVAAGTKMYCLFDIANDATDAHVGLLLLALEGLVRQQALGGYIRCGFGRYTADLTLTRNDQTFQVFTQGANAANARLSDEVRETFVKAALRALEKLTATEMAEFYTPQKKDKKDSAKELASEVAA